MILGVHRDRMHESKVSLDGFTIRNSRSSHPSLEYSFLIATIHKIPKLQDDLVLAVVVRGLSMHQSAFLFDCCIFIARFASHSRLTFATPIRDPISRPTFATHFRDSFLATHVCDYTRNSHSRLAFATTLVILVRDSRSCPLPRLAIFCHDFHCATPPLTDGLC